MPRTATIRLRNQYLKFAAAHFTIFSATERERLHGHNFYVEAEFSAAVGEDGLCFDYNIMKTRLRELCESLDEYVLLPANSPYLTINANGQDIDVEFNGRKLVFADEDTILLPIRNVTAEELSDWLLHQAINPSLAKQYQILDMRIAVSSGPGQSVSSYWVNEEPQQ
ncbi:MAG: 6-carboxytetrahydropterin synthase [Pseudomonadota bacterium]